MGLTVEQRRKKSEKKEDGKRRRRERERELLFRGKRGRDGGARGERGDTKRSVPRFIVLLRSL